MFPEHTFRSFSYPEYSFVPVRRIARTIFVVPCSGYAAADVPLLSLVVGMHAADVPLLSLVVGMHAADVPLLSLVVSMYAADVHKRLTRTLFIMAKNNMPIFGVSSF